MTLNRQPGRTLRVGWASNHKLHMANDDQACLKALDILWLWAKARERIPSQYKIVRVGVNPSLFKACLPIHTFCNIRC